jgi:hypothetical protein
MLNKTIICIIKNNEYHPLVMGLPGNQYIWSSNDPHEIKIMTQILLCDSLNIKILSIPQETFDRLCQLMKDMEQYLLTMCENKIKQIMSQCQCCLGPYIDKEGEIDESIY